MDIQLDKLYKMSLLLTWICSHLFIMVLGQTPQFIDPINQVTSCTCQTSAGLIDLSLLDTREPYNPLFYDLYDENNIDRYSWNPCSDFIEDSVTCNNIAACQWAADFSLKALGKQNSAEFVKDPTTGLEIKYSQIGSDQITRTSHVQLICDESADTALLHVKGENPPGQPNYFMSLTSKHCCPVYDPDHPVGPGTSATGLSIGSILCIVLAALLVVYIVGGMAFNRTKSGATGVEMVPNLTFWQSIPSLAKDGVYFVVGKVKGRAGYEEM